MGTSDASSRNLAGPAVACTVGVYLLYAITRTLGADSLAPLVLLAGFLFAPMWMLRRTPQLARASEKASGATAAAQVSPLRTLGHQRRRSERSQC